MFKSAVGLQLFRFDEMAMLINHRVDKPAESGVERYVGLEHLDADSLRIRRWGEVTDVESTKLRFKPGDIIFGKRRVYQRKLAVADFEGICSAHAMVLRARPDVVFPEFLPFFMQANHFMERALAISVGSLSPTINWSALAKERFAIPSVDEQQRIAEVLEAADEACSSLRTLECRTLALLSAAVASIMASCPLRTIGALVESGLIDAPQDGNHGEKHPRGEDYVSQGIPFVMASDLRNGVVEFNTCKKLREEQARSLRIGFAHEGDILLSHKGTVGSVARLTELAAPFAMLTPQVTYYRVRDHRRLHPDWLYFVFQSQAFQQKLVQYSQQSTRAYIGITAQQDLAVPICEYADQVRHVAYLHSIESSLVKIRERISDFAKVRERLITVGLPG